MTASDIVFTNDNIKFNFRVGLIIQNNGRFLLQKSIKDVFWGLIGGRVQLGENTKSAAVREAKEELEINIKEDDLEINFISENFFYYNAQRYHEILYVYRYNVDEQDEISKKDNFQCCDNATINVKWFNLAEIKDLDLRPSFVKNSIENRDFQFVINDE